MTYSQILLEGGWRCLVEALSQPLFSGPYPVIQATIATVLLSFLISQTVSLYKARASVLSKIPGPWYAAYITVHLQYLFARGTIWKYVEKQHERYGPVMRLGPRQIWISDKDSLKDILKTTDLPKVTMYAEISREKTSPGLFGEIREGPHTKLKRFLGPAFTVSAVDELDGFFVKCTSVLLRSYYNVLGRTSSKATLTTDFMRDLHCLALDIMGESNFGKGFGQIDKIFDPTLIRTRQDKEWAQIPDAIFDGQMKRYGLVYIKRTLRKFGVKVRFDWPRKMTQAISSLIDDRRTDDEATVKGRRKDILQHMLDEGNKPDTGVRMNNQDIIDQMAELLLAGSETTSGTIACLFLEIVRTPDIKAKLLASLPVLGPDDAILDSKTVRQGHQYRYLEACIKEGLRMHPIASELSRRTVDFPYHVAGYDIPPYTVVSASYRSLHRNEQCWPEAGRFWPERWLEDDEERGEAPKPDLESYFPFSAGKHSCIGRNFAYAEIRTVTSNILSRFDMEEVEANKDIDFRQFITMQFHDGSWKTRLTRRH